MNPKIASLLSEYPIITQLPVQWANMDAAQHVNNTVYLTWFESGRIDYFEAFGLNDFSGEFSDVGPILGSVQCKYIFPMTYPDTAYIGTRVRNIQEDRFVVETAVVSERHERLAALGSGVVVAYDYKALKKAVFPAMLLDKIREREGLK